MNRSTRKLLTRNLPKILLLGIVIVTIATMFATGKALAGTMMLPLVGMAAGSFNKAFSLGGYAFSNGPVAGSTFDGIVALEVTLPVAHAVTAWVKTDADTAACNLAGGHGQTSGTYDVFWTAGGANFARYGVDNTITTNACALDGGDGDDFPATATATVTIVKQTSITCNIDGDNVVLFGVFLRSSDSAAFGSADFQDAGPASIEQFDLTEVDTTAAGMAHTYQQTAARALLTGNVITSIQAGQSSTTNTATLFVLCGQDATP